MSDLNIPTGDVKKSERCALEQNRHAGEPDLQTDILSHFAFAHKYRPLVNDALTVEAYP